MEILLEWEAPEYTEHKKSADWYWYLALFAALLLIFAAYERSLLFGSIVVIGWFTIMLYSARAPKNLKISISEQGIFVEQTLYPWTNIKSFWIFPAKSGSASGGELSLELKKTLMPYIKIPLDEINPKTVREVILKFAPEKEQKESFVDNLSDLVRF